MSPFPVSDTKTTSLNPPEDLTALWDLAALARVLQRFACKYGVEAQRAFAFVIVNRARALENNLRQTVPLTAAITHILSDLGSFENLGPPQRAASSFSSPKFRQSVSIAVSAIDCLSGDPTNGATRLHAHDVLPPKWTKRLNPSALIGPWIFYAPENDVVMNGPLGGPVARDMKVQSEVA